MDRQGFLKIVGMGTSTLAISPFIEKVTQKRQMYSSPQIVGEIDQTSAILQTRLVSQDGLPIVTYNTPKALVSGDINGVDGVARFEIADNPSFNNIMKMTWKEAIAENDYIIKQKITNLKAGTHYYMRVCFGQTMNKVSTGQINHFKTLPAKDSEESVSFVVSSCLNLGYFLIGADLKSSQKKEEWRKPADGRDRKLGYRALESIQELRPDFWVQTGDTVYYDHPGSSEKWKEYRAKTRRELRAKWHRQMTLPRMQDLLQQVPTYWMIDDHDFRYNDSDDSKNDKRPSAKLAKDVYCEQLPVANPNNGAKDEIYRTRRVNKHLQIWTMNGRFHRENNRKPDGPNKSIWGKEQYKWLKETLISSNATFKVLIIGTPLIGPDDAYKHDNHVDYGGFQYERDHFFHWLQKHNFLERSLYFVTGDRHWQYHSIHPSGFEEFGTGTITTQNARHGRKPGDPHSTDPLGFIKQPYIQEEPIGGFLKITVNPPMDDRPPTLTFFTMDEDGNILNSETKRAEQGKGMKI